MKRLLTRTEVLSCKLSFGQLAHVKQTKLTKQTFKFISKLFFANDSDVDSLFVWVLLRGGEVGGDGDAVENGHTLWLRSRIPKAMQSHI